MILFVPTGDDSTGRPSIKSGGCSCSVDRVDIDIHGDTAFFFNLLKHEIEKRVRALIPGIVCDAVNDEVNNKAESQLKKLKGQSFLRSECALVTEVTSFANFPNDICLVTGMAALAAIQIFCWCALVFTCMQLSVKKQSLTYCIGYKLQC